MDSDPIDVSGCSHIHLKKGDVIMIQGHPCEVGKKR
jgi:translation elongation factor P/translation initiation factor 5A